ncbi:MAG: hypothetical protein V1809_00715 [Planctomycetota bacterium]
MGGQIAASLVKPVRYGRYDYLYDHFNVLFSDLFSPATHEPLKMRAVKRFPPYAAAAFRMMANLKYNLDGGRQPWQRVWVAPFSAALRHQHVSRAIRDHVSVKDDVVRIIPWQDELMGRQVPDSDDVTFDLHGQTFYVKRAQDAKLYVGEREVNSFKRNPADLTGRESITVIDTTTPTSVLDEIDLYERNGRVLRSGVGCYFQRRESYRGDYSLELRAERKEGGSVSWQPFQLDSHETDYVRFAYRKTNPQSRISIGWRPANQTDVMFVATEGDLRGSQGWEIPHRQDGDYHEVVLDFADMKMPVRGGKRIPRCAIGEFNFGMENCNPGDGVFFDCVEFLSARGVPVAAPGKGVVIGGRVLPPEDGREVVLKTGRDTRTSKTSLGGWYWFNNVPRGEVISLTSGKGGVEYFPGRGRLAQAVKNDLEFNIYQVDAKCNSVPRALALISPKNVTPALANRAVNADAQWSGRFGSLLAPHSLRFYAGFEGWDIQYVAESQANNFGFLDKDRRSENPDKSLRILLLGECWTEGLQTTASARYATLLESMLRRALNRNVEVIVYATSNATIGTNAIAYEKYGRQFKPDLIALMSNGYAAATMNGDLQKKIVGWDPRHAPYRMYDFDGQGRLIRYEADPNYPAYMEKPVPAGPDQVPWGCLLMVNTELTPDAQKALLLFETVLKESYCATAREDGGRVALVYGYNPREWGPAKYGETEIREEYFSKRMRDVCGKIGVTPLDLAPFLKSLNLDKPYESLTWEKDGHLSPNGHYMLARAIADQIIPFLK